MNPWHQVDAHELSVADVPAIVLCFLRVTSLHGGSVSMSECWHPAIEKCLGERLGRFVPLSLRLFSLHCLSVWKAV